MRRDIFYEVKYLIHCIMSRGTGIGFCWIPSHCGNKGEMKKMSEISYSNLLLSSHEITSILEKNVDKQIEKSKYAIPSCSRYLARAIYKLRLKTWNTKYEQNVTCVCKNILSVKHILLE